MSRFATLATAAALAVAGLGIAPASAQLARYCVLPDQQIQLVNLSRNQETQSGRNYNVYYMQLQNYGGAWNTARDMRFTFQYRGAAPRQVEQLIRTVQRLKGGWTQQYMIARDPIGTGATAMPMSQDEFVQSLRIDCGPPFSAP